MDDIFTAPPPKTDTTIKDNNSHQNDQNLVHKLHQRKEEKQTNALEMESSSDDT